MIEPGIAAHVAAAMIEPARWADYLSCRICGAAAGRACTAMHARVENGGTSGGPVELSVPHGSRRRRARR
jgi:hypothetical protein